MSVVQECALVEQAITRARCLVSACNSPPENAVVGGIDYAAESADISARLADDSSGAVISAHRQFVVGAAAALNAAEQ